VSNDNDMPHQGVSPSGAGRSEVDSNQGQKRTDPSAVVKVIYKRHEFVDSTKASHLQFLDKRGRVSAKLSKVTVAVHNSTPVFDVFVQQ
jgi:hypothetical protein